MAGTALLKAVPSTAAPAAAELAADVALAWRLFGIRQTGQLDVANTRAPDAVDIIRKCEARDRQAAEMFTRPWWRFWG